MNLDRNMWSHIQHLIQQVPVSQMVHITYVYWKTLANVIFHAVCDNFDELSVTCDLFFWIDQPLITIEILTIVNQLDPPLYRYADVHTGSLTWSPDAKANLTEWKFHYMFYANWI